jgi:hypothetical protein
MSMTRAQLEEQIRGFAKGGTPDPFQGYLTPAPPAAGLPNPSPFRGYLEPETETEQERIDRLRKQAEEIIAKRQQEALDTQREKRDEAFTYGMERYKKQLAPLLSSSSRPTLFDLASDLGAAMLAAPADAGAFRSAGAGFAAFNERLRTHRQEKRQVDQQVALKAFELAKTDEKEANDYLNQYSLKRLELANRKTNYETYEYDYTDPVTGDTSRRTVTLDENNPADMGLIRGSTDAKGRAIAPELANAVQVKKPDVALNMGSSSALADAEGKSLAKAFEKMAEDAETGYHQNQMINQLNAVLAELGPEGVGIVEGKTVAIRKLLSEIGVKEEKNLGNQELLQSLGTRIAMQLIGQTKGAITEMEMNLFIAASPGLGSSYEGLIKQTAYLKKIADLNESLFADFNADEQLAADMDAAQTDSQKARIYNNWLVNWRRSPKNQFLNPNELRELNKLAAEENEVAMAYRLAHPSQLGKFEGIDATGQGY